jgi:cytochrome c oxidase accessory protein FixG
MLENPTGADSGRSVPGADGVDVVDVAAVNRTEQRSLYKSREKIFPKRARGTFRRIKWAVMSLALAVYYLAPWLRWDRGPAAPDQAILIDFPARRFYFFFIEIWPQEVYYLTGLLIIASLTLFLLTSLAGRVWCGYMCPQTVWTDLFLHVERWVEGDRSARIRLDKASWGAAKIGKRVIKHAIWIAIALCTGGAWVFYFADAPTLLRELVTGEAPQVAYIFVALLSGFTYVLGGLAREQVCIYMCPWPRIQAAMIDEDSLIVSYHPGRGEPRGPIRKGQQGANKGDCIACNQCVVVCPMGIDIRDGMQLECVSCALCIDACNEVMDKVNLPRGLIGYDTIANVARREAGERTSIRPIRPRTILYAGLIALVGAIMVFTLISRADLDLNVLRDRNPLFVRLSDGSVRNGYTVKVLNKAHEERTFELAVNGLGRDARLKVVGGESGNTVNIVVEPDKLRSVKVFVTAPPGAFHAGASDISFAIRHVGGSSGDDYATNFRAPE